MAEKSAYEARLAVSVTGGGMTERPDRQTYRTDIDESDRKNCRPG